MTLLRGAISHAREPVAGNQQKRHRSWQGIRKPVSDWLWSGLQKESSRNSSALNYGHKTIWIDLAAALETHFPTG